MSKKPSYFTANINKLNALCEQRGYLIENIGDELQYRVYGATHVIDIWPSRMVYHRIKGENISANEPYYRGLDWEFNEKQVAHLLDTGEFVK